METKHTPGPWGHGRTKAGRLHVFCVAPKAPHSSQICAMWNHSEITEANMRVIAAAPDLLRELIAARNELAGLPMSLGYDFTSLPAIDAAIAKATA